MEATYAFESHNAETQYGYGTESQAIEYREYLNRYRGINCYQVYPATLTDEQAEAMAFNLADELGNI